MVKIYTDTNVLRYFGTAFANASLPEDLQVQLLLSPLTMMELLSQLGTDGAEEAFAVVQALPRVHNPAATGMLPWSDDLFRISVFNLAPGTDTITPALNNAVSNTLNAAKAEDLKEDGKQMRALLDKGKDEAAKNFAAVLKRLAVRRRASSRRASSNICTLYRPSRMSRRIHGKRRFCSE